MPQGRYPIGIDFGTSTSLVGVYELLRPHVQSDPESPDEDIAWTPSVVGVSTDDVRREARLAVGWNINSIMDSRNVIRWVKRHLGEAEKRYKLFGTEYRPEEVAAVILHHVRLNAARKLGQPIRDVVLSIPANFGGAAREALLAAARMVELNPLRLVNEPTAAALSYALDRPQTDENLLVFDFGGGTLDITVLRKEGLSLTVQSTHGDSQLGGTDFDKVLQTLLSERVAQAHGEFQPADNFETLILNNAEKVKWLLSQNERANVFIPYVGVKGGRPLALNLIVTREEFIDAARPLLERAHRCLGEAVVQSGLLPEQIDRVLLVGGTVRIPAVAGLVQNLFGERCRIHQPITCVAEGAAVLAAHELGMLKGVDSELKLRDVAGHGLGLRYRCGTDGPFMYGCLINPNQPLPHKVVKDDLVLQTAQQNSALISLYEGRTTVDAPLDDAKFRHLRSVSIENIPSSQTDAPHRVRVEFSYDENAVVELKATVLVPGQNSHTPGEHAVPLRYDMRFGEKDFQESSERVRQLWSRTGLDWNPDTVWTKVLGFGGVQPVGGDGPGVKPVEQPEAETVDRLLAESVAEIVRLKSLPVVDSTKLLRDIIREALEKARPVQRDGTVEQKHALNEDLRNLLKRFQAYVQ